MTEPTEVKTYDGSIADMVKLLINDLVAESDKNGYGDTPREKIRNHLKHGAGENTMHGITALSSYMEAKASERQAVAMESIAKSIARTAAAETVSTDAQAIVDQREPRREYLASTYSLPSDTLSLLWAMRGMLMDASIKSLSRPDRFDPFRKVTTAEIAWSLRLSELDFYILLPRTPSSGGLDFDFDLLQAFGIMHYGGTDGEPDDWMYSG